MNSATYDKNTNSIIITIDGGSYVIPFQGEKRISVPLEPSWRGAGGLAMVGIMHAVMADGMFLPPDVVDQIVNILTEQGLV